MNDYDRVAQRVDKKIHFYRNFIAYIIVNAFLAMVNYFASPDFWWVLFPVIFWGIGVFADFLKAFVFAGTFDEEYRQRKIAEEMEKMKL